MDNSPTLDVHKGENLRFVIQEHIRKECSHIDMRFDVGDHLIGFALETYPKKEKVLAQIKSRQPKEMLKISGELSAGDAGATKDLPSKFIIKDKGTYEMGAQKTDFLEVFLKGKTRFVFKKLQRRSDIENANKKPLVWYAWYPTEQTPFILSKESIEEGFVPPKGMSAMSKDWEGKVPNALQWWKKNWTGEKALKSIKEIRSILLKRSILKRDKSIDDIKAKKIENTELTPQQISNLKLLSTNSLNSLSEIAGMVGCSKSTVVYQQKKLRLK